MKEKFIHGKLRTPTYISWCAMSQRCKDSNHMFFKNYGGRGIIICERWHKFENFLEDMGERPEGMSIDRWPDKNGNYEPNNCRWATRSEQRFNSRPISCGPAKQRWFRAWHKDNMMVQCLSNSQHEFAKEHKLDSSAISKCLLKKQKQHKGWYFFLADTLEKSS